MAPPDYDVMIVGGGPVGLLLANLLGRSELRTLLIERNARPPAQSMAIGITPPSLELLRRLDLDRAFVRQGVRVDHAVIHENNHRVGELRFHTLKHSFPFILSIPQSTTAKLLGATLADHNHVTVLAETCFISATQSNDRVVAVIRRKSGTDEERISAAFLVGCDGHRSRVREVANIALVEQKEYPQQFAMADACDRTSLGQQAHLYFSRHGSIESFPLPEQKRRWILQRDDRPEPLTKTRLIQRIRCLTGHDLDLADCGEADIFSVRRFVSDRYFRDRMILCGDAAHVMSPIGGQGMNTGFADADFLADALLQHFRHKEDITTLLTAYNRCRRIAFKVAADRAERGMRLGTLRGLPASILRRILIGTLLIPHYKHSLPAYFAMLTIPRPSLRENDGMSA